MYMTHFGELEELYTMEDGKKIHDFKINNKHEIICKCSFCKGNSTSFRANLKTGSYYCSDCGSVGNVTFGFETMTKDCARCYFQWTSKETEEKIKNN